MPCIWGKHNGSQVFLSVAIFDDDVVARFSAAAGTSETVRMHVFKALVDTGAQGTCITSAAAEKVGLAPIGKVQIRGVGGLSFHNNYLFRVGFAFGGAGEGREVRLGSLHIVDEPIQGAELNIRNSDFDVLLGMDIISIGSLKIDGDGSFSFSF
jgi:hypothetical protein